MPRISSMPCSVPSSPGRPCSTLSATSGLTVPRTVAMSRPTSMRVTRYPSRTSASAQALPERSDTSRAADQPPIRTATCFIFSSSFGWFGERRFRLRRVGFQTRGRACPGHPRLFCGGIARKTWMPAKTGSPPRHAAGCHCAGMTRGDTTDLPQTTLAQPGRNAESVIEPREAAEYVLLGAVREGLPHDIAGDVLGVIDAPHIPGFKLEACGSHVA